MSKFPINSVWAQIEEARQVNPNLTQADLKGAIEAATRKIEEEQTKQAKTAREDLPLGQWRHDLETIDILLGQHPPDIERARHMLDDIQREIQQEL